MADTAITLSSVNIVPLSAQEKAATGFTHKFHIDYTDIDSGTGTEDTVTVTLGNTPASWIVDKAAVSITTAFAGSSGLALIVGTTVDDNAFIESQAVTTGAIVLTPTTSIGMNAVATNANSKGTAATSMTCKFTNTVGGSPASLTAGALDIYLSIQDRSDWP